MNLWTLFKGSLLVAIMVAANQTQAAVIVDLAGDRDSFGTGKADGSTVSVNEILVPGGEEGDFDQWALGSFSWQHAFGIPVGQTIIAASLTIATLDLEDNGAGDGLGGGPFDTLLFLDGMEFLGAFDNVFTPDGNANTLFTPNVTIFDLTPFLASLADGNLNVLVNPLGGTFGDSISIDYGELRIETRLVPEPSTIALLALGVVAIALRRRR